MTANAQSVAEPSIQDAGHAHLVATMPMGEECAVHRHREWVPIESHHVWPEGLGGPNVAANRISVCCNGHYSIHEFMRQLMIHHGVVPAEVAQHFGKKVRSYATTGWALAGKPVHGGGE